MATATESVVDKRLRLLGEDNDRLSQLLADPHPGLHTWILAVCDSVRAMTAVIDGQRDDEHG